MLTEAAQELASGHCTGSRFAGAIVAELVLEGDRFIIDTGDPAVGDGGAMDISGDVFDHVRRTFAPGCRVDDPGFAPDLGRDLDVPELGGERGAQLAADQLGESLDRDQEAVPNIRMPVAAVTRDAAAGDQAMDVRMEPKLLGPGFCWAGRWVVLKGTNYGGRVIRRGSRRWSGWSTKR